MLKKELEYHLSLLAQHDLLIKYHSIIDTNDIKTIVLKKNDFYRLLDYGILLHNGEILYKNIINISSK